MVTTPNSQQLHALREAGIAYYDAEARFQHGFNGLSQAEQGTFNGYITQYNTAFEAGRQYTPNPAPTGNLATAWRDWSQTRTAMQHLKAASQQVGFSANDAELFADRFGLSINDQLRVNAAATAVPVTPEKFTTAFNAGINGSRAPEGVTAARILAATPSGPVTPAPAPVGQGGSRPAPAAPRTPAPAPAGQAGPAAASKPATPHHSRDEVWFDSTIDAKHFAVRTQITEEYFEAIEGKTTGNRDSAYAATLKGADGKVDITKFDATKMDGIFGQKTSDDVKVFQTQWNKDHTDPKDQLAVDGHLDEKTFKAINDKLEANLKAAKDAAKPAAQAGAAAAPAPAGSSPAASPLPPAPTPGLPAGAPRPADATPAK